ncbi:MAG: trimeric intracellular cation channel family protein [Litorivicinaceae bacterium]
MIDPVTPSILMSVQSGIEVFAVIAFALSGLAAGLRVGMDFVGICFVAGVSAFGGGTLRDVLLDRRPFFWVEQDHLLWLVIILCLLASIFVRRSHAELTEKWIQVPDAIGLGLFAALGTQIALIEGASIIVAVLMGVISSTLGGVLRDILCNVVPKAFSDHQPYIAHAVLGSVVLVGLDRLDVTPWISLVMAVVITTVTRLIVLALNVSIPAWRA